MKILKSHKYPLLIICVGLLLRILWLGNIPTALFRDEAALGYNAYSIWKTGKDEFGMQFPIVFRSFEVFFLPLYVYLSAPLVGIMGLSEFTTRLLSSLSGVSLLVITYFISSKIWNKKIGLIATFCLAIAPWHIFYSRGAFEGNLALTLFSLGFLFWLKFLDKSQVKYFTLSILSFAASMYSYQAERLVVVLFAVVAAYLAKKRLWQLRRKLVIPILFTSILLVPLLSLTLSPGGYHRAFGVSVFSQENNPAGWSEDIESGLVANNQLLLRARQITALYLSYFSPRNLFVEGDANMQRSVENYGVLYVWMLPFLLYGTWTILQKRSVNAKLLLIWLVISPLPAALTGDPFHTYRSFLTYLPLILLVGVGMRSLYANIEKRYKKLFLAGGFTAISLSVALFLFNYAVITPGARGRAWDHGYKEIIEYLQNQEADKVIVDDITSEAYIYFLYFEQVDPIVYHEEVEKLGVLTGYYYVDASEIRPVGFGRYEFRQVDWPSERGNTGTIFVIEASRLPESEYINDPKATLLKEIYYPNGEVAYKIVKII